MPMTVNTGQYKTAEDIDGIGEKIQQWRRIKSHIAFNVFTQLLSARSLNPHRQDVCGCVSFFYILPAREPQPRGKSSRPTQSGVYQNPLRISTYTHPHTSNLLLVTKFLANTNIHIRTRQTSN